MENIRVEYTMTVTVTGGEELSFKNERILTEQDDTRPEHVHSILEQDFRETEHTPFLTALQAQLGKEIIGITLLVNTITSLKPAGDDDQM